MIIDLWAAGKRDDAVRAFLAQDVRRPPATWYRPYNLTEADCVRLPIEELEALKARMLVKVEVLREMVRDEFRRANELATANNPIEARRILEAIKRLGAANRSPEVCLLMGMIGKHFEARADEGLAKLEAAEHPLPTQPERP